MRWSALLLAFVVSLALASPLASAQGQMDILSFAAENHFPNGVVFRLEVQTPYALQKAILSYKIGEEETFRTAAPPFMPGRKITAEYVFGSKTEGSYIHPNAEVAYTWSLEDSAGNRMDTPLSTIVYSDTRFTWRQISREGVTISWYRGGEPRQLLDQAVADLRRATSVVGVSRNLSVEVMVYASLAEMRDALPWKSRDTDPKLPTLGLQVSPTAVLLLGNQPDTTRTLTHELSHVVMRQGIGYIPSWLDEGLALLAEGDLAVEHATTLEQAVRSDDLFSLRSMIEVPDARNPHGVWLFYGQAYSVTRFLIDAGGQEKLKKLMALLKDGKPFDQALQDVYGWNTDSLELDWRDGMGLPPHLGKALNAPMEAESETASAPKRPFRAFAALAATFAGLIFLIPFAVLSLVSAVIALSRRDSWS